MLTAILKQLKGEMSKWDNPALDILSDPVQDLRTMEW